jgi:hypothetical protein
LDRREDREAGSESVAERDDIAEQKVPVPIFEARARESELLLPDTQRAGRDLKQLTSFDRRDVPTTIGEGLANRRPTGA